MDTFLRYQKIKQNKTIKDFDYLSNWDGVHTSNLNERQCLTDKYFWKLINMYTNSYNSISCFGWTLRSKIRRKSKKSKKIKEFDSFDYLINKSSLHLFLVFFTLFYTLQHLHKTGNGIIAMWTNTMSSLSVERWPWLR